MWLLLKRYLTYPYLLNRPHHVKHISVRIISIEFVKVSKSATIPPFYAFLSCRLVMCHAIVMYICHAYLSCDL